MGGETKPLNGLILELPMIKNPKNQNQNKTPPMEVARIASFMPKVKTSNPQKTCLVKPCLVTVNITGDLGRLAQCGVRVASEQS